MVDWPVTFRCNNNCISCISNTSLSEGRGDPPWEQIKFVIDTVDQKKDYLGISGGEPTLRNELFNILSYARERHPDLYIFIVSNGRMFSYMEYAKKLAGLGLDNFMVGIALYGPDAGIHDSITRSAGSFAQTVQGIKNLLELGIPVEIRVVINRLNYTALDMIAAFVVREFPSASRMVFLNMKMTGNAYINRDSVMVKIKETVPHAEKAIGALSGSGIEARLYHFPLCTIPESLWGAAAGVTKTDPGELRFVDTCAQCDVKDRCSMIWSTYVGLAGDGEFHAVKRRP